MTSFERLSKLAVMVAVVLFDTVICQDFGYEGSEGPNHWGEKYHQCVGKHQSPINIDDHNVLLAEMKPIKYENFNLKPASAKMTNNGHTVVLTLNTKRVPLISGGPLLGRYKFSQLHFHWGSNDFEGSENRINNNSFPMELHMVFYQGAYGSQLAAMEHPDGLTVLSFLYSNAKTENKIYKPIIDALPNLIDSHTTKIVKNIPTFEELIVHNRSTYYTYGGSLTTPPCSEIVTWIEFKNTIPLTHDQLEVFRQLKSEDGKRMTHNYRPPQPLHGRVIRYVTETNSSSRHNTHLRHLVLTLILSYILTYYV